MRLICPLKVFSIPLLKVVGVFAFGAVLTAAQAAYVPAYRVVMDHQDFDVQADGSFIHTREMLTQIDTPQGIDQFGQAKIYYDGKRAKLDVVEAYTIRANGERVPVTPDRIRRVSASTDDVSPYFTDQMIAIVIFPHVEVGSRLYYKAVLHEVEPVIKGRFSDLTAFTPHRSYQSAVVTLTHASDMQVNAYAKGVNGGRSELPDGRIQYRYDFKQSAAYPYEPSQVDFADFSPVVEFSNYRDYADLAQVTQKLFEEKTRVTPNIQKLADGLTNGVHTQREKAKTLYNWVSANIRYVGIDVGASGFEPHYADEILANRYGDCKDHAVLLEALLRAVGILSSPALINTEPSYQLPKLAGNFYFNHVITFVPEFDLYLDSTAQFAEFGTLPPADMGKPTLITESGVVHATPKTSSKSDYTVTHTKLRLMADGSFEGSSRFEPHGYYKTASRMAQFAYENRDTQTVVDRLLKRFLESGTGEMTHPDPADLSAKWSVGSQYTLEPSINMTGMSAFSVPTGLVPGYIKTNSSEKPYEGRRNPYECGSSKHVEYVEISLPRGVIISRIPKGLEAVTGVHSYKSIYKAKGNKIFVTRTLTTERDGDVCKPSQLQLDAQTFMRDAIRSDLRSQIFIN